MRSLYQIQVTMFLRVEPEAEGEATARLDIGRIVSNPITGQLSTAHDPSENRMENISRKIDDLTEMMNRLSQGQLGTITVPQPTRPEPGPETQREATSSRGTIEPSLFSQAVFATDFLQAAVANDPHSQIAGEMTSAIDALSNVIEAQKRHNDICEGSNPFDKPLPPGVSSKNLPLPNLDKVMACLRMAQGLYSRPS